MVQICISGIDLRLISLLISLFCLQLQGRLLQKAYIYLVHLLIQQVWATAQPVTSGINEYSSRKVLVIVSPNQGNSRTVAVMPALVKLHGRC